MHGFKQDAGNRADSPAERRPAGEFFKKHVASIPRRGIERAVRNYRIVKNAAMLRNEDGGDEIRMKVKFPAAQIIANKFSYATIYAATLLLTKITSWSTTVQAVAGGIAGDYAGNVLAFAAAWYFFSIGRFSKIGGMKKFLSEGWTFMHTSLYGIGTKFYRKVGELESGAQGFAKWSLAAAKPLAWLAGAAISPVPVAYCIYGPMISAFVAVGMSAPLAAVAGGIGSNTIFMAYTYFMNRRFLSRLEDEQRGPGLQ